MKSLYKVHLQNNYILVLLVFQTNEEEGKKTEWFFFCLFFCQKQIRFKLNVQ